jgi:hypothetical protein
MYMKSVCFSAFILHISGTDKCKIGVRYIIFRPVISGPCLFGFDIEPLYNFHLQIGSQPVIKDNNKHKRPLEEISSQ